MSSIDIFMKCMSIIRTLNDITRNWANGLRKTAYDSNGNMATKVNSGGTTQYFWDFENRLSSVTLPGTGGTVTFKYDPFGRRIYKSSSSVTSVFAYDGNNLIEETNSSGTAVARYAHTEYVDEPLAMLRSSTTSYYQADGLGTITSLSSGAGALAQTYTFDSFGEQTASSGTLTNPFQYTARELDPETNLYYYRARYYDPGTGKFLSEDPIRFEGGLNFYGYAGDSPANATDPLGEDYSVAKNGNTITVSASIVIYGEQAEPVYAQMWQNWINKNWNAAGHAYKGCDVKFKVTITADPTANHWVTANSAQNYIYVVPAYPKPTGPSTTGEAHGWGGKESFWVQHSWGDWNQSAGDFEISHEAGHLFGLFDGYNLKTGRTDPGRQGDIMAGGGKISQYDIDQIIKGQVCGCN